MPARESKFVDRLFNDRWTKLVAVVLALAVWYAIQDVIRNEKEVAGVPIEIPVEDGWAILDRSVTEATVTFRGTKDAIRNLDREEVRLVRDIRGRPESGSMLLTLHPRNVETSQDVRAVKIDPDRIEISLDQEAARSIPVKAVIQGDLPDGFEAGEIVCRPAMVKLFGPRQRLDEMEAVHTEPIEMTGLTRPVKLRRRIDPPGDSWIARVDPDRVVVEVEVIERSANREFAGVPIATMLGVGSQQGLELSETNTTVVLEGRSEVLEAISRQSIQAYVDCRALRPVSTTAVPVRVHPPVGVIVKSVEPAEVFVTLFGFGEDS